MAGQMAGTAVRIGLIGCGARGSGLARLATSLDAGVSIAAVADPDEQRARERLAEGVASEKTRWLADADELLAMADRLDALIIATRCHQHTPMAVAAAATGLPLYLEKPVGISHEQLADLWAALGARDAQVVVSFPLRLTPVFEHALDIVRSGRLGRINQVQAFNNVPYGGCYFGDHYRNFDESGGLWLQKATHDFDYINVLMGSANAQQVAATSTQVIYGGDRPHDLKCSQCDDTQACMESPENIRLRDDAGGMNWGGISPGQPNDHWCAFSREIRNQDAGAAFILYDDGSHANYVQNFVTRRSAGRRGATITGYKGTLDFDFGGSIRVVEHHRNIVDKTEVKATGGHGGGDPKLMKNFIDIARGQAESLAPLSAGILSAALTLAARESAETHTFQPVPARY